MTERQLFALNNVTAGLEQKDLLFQYSKIIARGPRRFGTILTADVRPEGFFWHACVSLINPEAMPIELDNLSLTEKAATIRLCEELLSDIGRSDSDFVHEEKRSFHLIRQLTIEEVGQAKIAVSPQPK
jgi:hypothetical protein